MASSYDILVIPHISSVYSYHLQFAFTNCPIAEYINMSPKVGRCNITLVSIITSLVPSPSWAQDYIIISVSWRLLCSEEVTDIIVV